eukprot:scaffold282500_cov18-Tisochrysis_lutea.AAC.1
MPNAPGPQGLALIKLISLRSSRPSQLTSLCEGFCLAAAESFTSLTTRPPWVPWSRAIPRLSIDYRLGALGSHLLGGCLGVSRLA